MQVYTVKVQYMAITQSQNFLPFYRKLILLKELLKLQVVTEHTFCTALYSTVVLSQRFGLSC